MKRASALLLLALLGACDDGPSGPEPVRSVDIVFGTLPVEEESLVVGETVQLGANLSDGGGRPLTERPITWRSTAPEVATVTGTGLLTAAAAGTAEIIASAERAADTILVTVRDRVILPGEIACEPGTSPLALDVGEVATVIASQQPVVCLAGGAGSEYAFIPFHASASTTQLKVEVAASGTAPALGPPNPALLARGAGPELGRAAAAAPLPDRRIDRRMRDWESRNYAALRSSAGSRDRGASVSRASVARRVPAVGDTLYLNVNAVSSCSDPDRRVGRVEAVTEHAIIVADTANPSGGFTRSEYRDFGVTFDTLVWDVSTRNFGEPQDFDENEKILVFFTRAVNELSEEGSNSVVGGYFYGRDLFERDGVDGCPGSNEGELFYMLVPDPTGLVNSNVRMKDFVAGRTVAVLAHEFQHLINFSRRLFVNDAPFGEETWLNEGLSHIAEELVFYEAANVQPESNIDVETLRASQPVFDRFIEHQWSNFGRFISYLEEPASASPLADDDELSTRGSTWAFLRYAADRASAGGDDRQIWFDLVNTRSRGVANLRTVFGVDPIDWLEDWTVSVYADDSGLPVEGNYLQPSWNFRSILGPQGLRSAVTREPLFPVFPLDVVQLQSGRAGEEEFSLKGGGAAFLRFRVAAGGQAAVRTTSGGAVAPNRLRVMIVRTK